ncbi:MAG: hypothetical protein IJ748_05815 [Bacteroidales bacterium]|nr:hypothetical protein [Bacteroidales bacterium]
MKRIILVTALILMGATAFAQSSLPKPTNQAKSKSTAGLNRTAQQSEGPVGTATALLLGLATGTLVYKVKKHKKEE